MGSWFPDNLRLKVGNESNTLFWLDRWVGDVPLRDRFLHLFDLSKNTLLTVAQMFNLGWDEGREAWKWRRSLWVWDEDMVEECRTFANCCVAG